MNITQLFKNLFISPPRLARLKYILRCLFWFAVLFTPSIASSIFATLQSNTEYSLPQNGVTLGPLITIICYIVACAQLIMCHVSRLHDLNLSGWWLVPISLVNLIPGIRNITSVVTSLAFIFWPGTKGSNRFDKATIVVSKPIMSQKECNS